jgi:arylsulfatase A-like enzyme
MKRASERASASAAPTAVPPAPLGSPRPLPPHCPRVRPLLPPCALLQNGPWECKCQLSGSSGPFSGLWQKNNGGGSSAKTTLWEGGHRVVGLAHWPARIAAGGVTNALASSLDYLPTIAAVAGIALPGDRSFDGIDLSPVMAGRHAAARAGQALTAGGPPGAAGGHTELLHPLSGACGTGALDAVRQGRYKAMWSSGGAKGCLPDSAPCVQHAVPLLFDLTDDPAEEHALDATDPANAAIIASLTAVRAAKMADIDGTPRSTADYGSSAAGRAANCCNNTNMECACSLW